MSNTQRAVILCRSAKDPKGRSRADQEEYCRYVCEGNGWNVADVVSLEGTGTAAIERLSEVLRSGDILVAWDTSRISRKPSELDQFADECSARGVVWCLGGTVSADGLRVVRESRLRDNMLDTVREHIARGSDLPALEGSAGRFRDELVRLVREMDEGQ